MNQRFLTLKTLRSSARFTETEQSRVSIPRLRPVPAPTQSGLLSGLNPLLLLLTLSLLSSFTSYAWDDDEEFDAPSRSTRNNSSIYSTSTIDYGYKDPHQSRIQNQESKITYTQPQQAYEVSRTRALHIDTIQEANDKRSLKNEEFMADSQRRFEKQEAQQERHHAQMAKQQEIYDEMDQEECEMAEFLGGVYKATFGATTGRNSAVTSDGYVYRSGNNFITPKGIYTKSGNIFAGPDGITTQSGTLFFGSNPTTIQAGGAYFSEGESGYIVGPNCRNTSTWRSR
jgi:hypothetical protein